MFSKFPVVLFGESEYINIYVIWNVAGIKHIKLYQVLIFSFYL